MTIFSCLSTLTEIFFNDIPVATLANPKIAARDAEDTPTGNPTSVSAVPVPDPDNNTENNLQKHLL